MVMSAQRPSIHRLLCGHARTVSRRLVVHKLLENVRTHHAPALDAGFDYHHRLGVCAGKLRQQVLHLDRVAETEGGNEKCELFPNPKKKTKEKIGKLG